MANIDQWTVDLLGNREVLAINQDPAGRPAARIWADNWTQVWARPLSDGTWAVGLFNRAPEPMPVTLKFADIALPDSSPIRYPWTHTDRGARSTTSDNRKQISETVPRHGVVLMKVGKAGKSIY
jgi:alpha-galactosidase